MRLNFASTAPGFVGRPLEQPAGSAFAKLATHMDIGWDLDGTLLNHAAAPALHRFIRATPRIRHVLITFRTRRRDVEPWAELAAYRDGPQRESFHALVFLDEAEAEGVARIERGRRVGWWRGEDARHAEWKGRVCAKHGLTALVDDKTHMVAAGCRRYRIELFHPAAFMPA